MDSIKAEKRKTKFCREPHLAIVVNGKTLDSLIAEAFCANTSARTKGKRSWLGRLCDYFRRSARHEFDYEGAVPTLLRFYDEIPDCAKAKKVVWERIDSVGEKPVIVPLLMCPDDLDFYCFVVVAEIRCVGDSVRWERIGADDSENRGFRPETLGEKVLWFEYLPPLVFPSEEYFECIETFRRALSNNPIQNDEIVHAVPQ